MSDSLYHLMMELDEFIEAIPEDIEEKDVLEEYNSIMERLENKVDGCVHYVDFITGRLAELEVKKKRIDDSIKRYKGKEQRIKDYLISCAKLSENSRLTSKNYTLRVQKNPPAVKMSFKPQKRSYEEVMPEILPLDMKPFIREKTVYIIDKLQLKNQIKAGDMQIESAWLEQSERIVVKGK